jgi:hypothetical protein
MSTALHSPTRFVPGEVFSVPEGLWRSYAIIGFISDDGHYGDLIRVPDGDYANVNRAEISNSWRPEDFEDFWYVEIWPHDGQSASWHAYVPHVFFVMALVKYIRARGQHEIVRVRSPHGIAQLDRDILHSLGAQPL